MNITPISINRKQPVVTYVLLGLNVAMYLISLLTGMRLGYNYALVMLGANVPVYVAGGQVWRLLTSMFLHAGFEHILFNGMALFIWGRQVEALLGRWKYAVVYLLGGLFGSCMSFALSSGGYSVGASGAIFAMFGALLYLRTVNKTIFNLAFGAQVLLIIGINLGLGFVSAGIDNWAHLGGLLGGFLISAGLGLYRENRIRFYKAAALFGYGFLFVLLLIYGYMRMR